MSFVLSLRGLFTFSLTLPLRSEDPVLCSSETRQNRVTGKLVRDQTQERHYSGWVVENRGVDKDNGDGEAEPHGSPGCLDLIHCALRGAQRLI